jgi:membrane-bound inhibitor of C-type lysozyme
MEMLRKLALAALAAMVTASVPPAQAQTFISYRCRDGTEFLATFYQGVRSVALKLDGKNITLPRRVSASGTRYSSGGITLRIKGKIATLTRGRQSTECTPD